MDWWVWIVSHLVVGGACSAGTRWVVLRSVEVVEHQGHLAIEFRHNDEGDLTT